MSKKIALVSCFILLGWFFLDMVGVYFDNSYLVTRSYQDDGIFFIIYLISLLLFIFKEKVGKYFLSITLTIWLSIQVLFHYGYKLVGQTTENKINYFNGSIKLFNINGYFPDLYHLVLHVLILVSLILIIIHMLKNKRRVWYDT